MKLHRSLTVWYIYIPHYITNLPHIVYAYRLVSVLSIHCCCCNLNENCFWTQSQRKLRFPPLLNVIKTSKETSQLLKYHIKPRENIGRHTYSVVLKFFVERPDFTKSLMSTKKQLNIIVNKKQRT